MARSEPADKWGNAVGTQAARINELLSVPGFRLADEVYDILKRAFPTTTVGRVRSHFRWLRKHRGWHLQEHRNGRRVAVWLV